MPAKSKPAIAAKVGVPSRSKSEVTVTVKRPSPNPKPKKMKMIGIAEANSPRKTYFRSNPGPKNSLVTTGTEFLSQVTPPSSGGTLAPGTILSTVGLNPTSFMNSRLALTSKMFEKYCIRRMKFHYQSACPTTTAGTFAMFVDRDVADQKLSGVSLIRQAYASSTNASGHWWESKTALYVNQDPQKFYYTQQSGVADRLTSPGYLYLLSTTSLDTTGILALGEIWVEYEIHWFDPTVEIVVDSAVSLQSAATLTNGTNQGFVGMTPTVSGNVRFDTDSSGNPFFRLPSQSPGTSSPGFGDGWNVTEAFSGLNSGAPSNGVVDQLTVQAVLANGTASNLVSMNNTDFLQYMTDSFTGAGNTLTAVTSWTHIHLPAFLNELTSGSGVIALLFNVSATAAIVYWKIYGTIPAPYATAATHTLTILPDGGS